MFFKGCPLRCLWCHNPESYEPERQLQFNPVLCIGCGACVERCPQGAHSFAEGEHVVLRDRCVECFSCATECYARALEVVGREMTAGEVLDEVCKDRPFYEQSSGGMTVSGGEPLLQPRFLMALLRGARERQLHVCLETCGFASWNRLCETIPLVDLYLFDCKETDPRRHLEYTGGELEGVMRNLRLLDAEGAQIILRCPLVPGYNLRDDHLAAIAELSRSLKHCVAVEAMGYHRLGESKVSRLGGAAFDRIPPEVPDMDDAATEAAVEKLREFEAVAPRRP